MGNLWTLNTHLRVDFQMNPLSIKLILKNELKLKIYGFVSRKVKIIASARSTFLNSRQSAKSPSAKACSCCTTQIHWRKGSLWWITRQLRHTQGTELGSDWTDHQRWGVERWVTLSKPGVTRLSDRIVSPPPAHNELLPSNWNEVSEKLIVTIIIFISTQMLHQHPGVFWKVSALLYKDGKGSSDLQHTLPPTLSPCFEWLCSGKSSGSWGVPFVLPLW